MQPAPSSIGSPLLWLLFLGLVLVMLALDLGVFHRRPHRVGFREALGWSLFWILLSLGFNLWIYLHFGSQHGLEFLAGYLIEKSLSVDNIFVFLVIFRYFAVPAEYQHRVLFWGILGAVVLRAIFILLGVALLASFYWVIYLFGGFLVYTGYKLLRHREVEVHPERNPVVRFFRRLVPISSDYHDQRFFTRSHGRLCATPLMLVVIMVEASDVVFAVDSIPAIFGVTRDPFIVFTSNILAVLGLRALYFVLAGMMHRFRFLNIGLGLVLGFIGLKMLLSGVIHLPIAISLGVISLLIGGSVLVSWLWPERQRDPDGAPRGPQLPEADGKREPDSSAP